MNCQNWTYLKEELGNENRLRTEVKDLTEYCGEARQSEGKEPHADSVNVQGWIIFERDAAMRAQRRRGQPDKGSAQGVVLLHL